jgi:hypothetical protein
VELVFRWDQNWIGENTGGNGQEKTAVFRDF